MNIALFYHCLFFTSPPIKECPAAIEVVFEQMEILKQTGLLDAAQHFMVGVNGGAESRIYVQSLIPSKAEVHYHGLECHNENRTVLALEQWLPGHEDWYVLYFHAKGATWPYSDFMRSRWRECMNRCCLKNWQRCVDDLRVGFEAVGVHYMEYPETPPDQRIFGGTFCWARASYLLTLPSIMDRERIKLSGLDSPESRYEAEVWFGNGPRRPRVRDYHPNWNPSKVHTCPSLPS